MMRRLCGLLVLTLLTLIALGDERPADDAKLKLRLENLGRSTEHLRDVLKIPGISAAVVKDQKVIWSKGFGLADVENKIPATPQTPYRIASLTKTFASTLLMQLVEQGTLDLDEPMSKYSPLYKDDLVKVRHVLTHTSGNARGCRPPLPDAYSFASHPRGQRFPGLRFGSRHKVCIRSCRLLTPFRA